MLSTSLIGIVSTFQLFFSTVSAEKFVLEPAVATAYNLRNIMDAMAQRRIERAQVAGWNNFRGVYVVYSNGTVTPPTPLNMPTVAVFFKKYKYGVTEIVFMGVNQLPCPRPCPPPPCDLVIPKPWKPIPTPPECKEVPLIPCPPTPCSPPRPDCCPAMPSICKKSDNNQVRNSSRVTRKRRSFKFGNECVMGTNVPVLSIDSSKRIRSKSLVYLTNGVRVSIAILNHPALLLKIKRFAEATIGCPVCLYVDGKSRVYVIRRGTIFQVCGIDKNLSLTRLSSRRSARIVRRGLYSVTI